MPLPSSFWVDEMATAFVVEHGAAHPSFAAAPQVPDSIYYWLPRASVRLFGHSEIAYRVPGVLVMALALWIIGDLAARLIHPDARWFAIFACLAMHGIDYYAVDARPYGLGIAIASGAMWFLTRWLDTAHWTDGFGFAFLAALLWRVHLLDWPMYLVFGGYAAARVTGKVKWARAAVIAGALALALWPVAWRAWELARQSQSHIFAELPGWREFLHQTRLNVAVFCLAGAWLLRNRGKAMFRRAASLPILLWWMLPPVCLFLLSRISGESVFVTRYVSVALPGAALAAALAASLYLPVRYWRPAALALGIGALAAMGQWTQVWPAHEHSGWRQAAVLVNQLAGAETPVICPSPFVEAKPPAWSPGYRLPGFLYAHLDFYPIAGRILPFPFQGIPALPASGPVILYGGVGGVRPIERRLTNLGWKCEIWAFGDVLVVRAESNGGSAIASTHLGEGKSIEAKMDDYRAHTLPGCRGECR